MVLPAYFDNCRFDECFFDITSGLNFPSDMTLTIASDSINVSTSSDSISSIDSKHTILINNSSDNVTSVCSKYTTTVGTSSN